MTLEGKSYTIVGVLPANYRYIGNNYQRSDVLRPSANGMTPPSATAGSAWA